MAELLLKQRLKQRDVVVDATVGNGHDTLLAAVMFNLGYLPGANKAVMTRSDTTLVAM